MQVGERKFPERVVRDVISYFKERGVIRVVRKGKKRYVKIVREEFQRFKRIIDDMDWDIPGRSPKTLLRSAIRNFAMSYAIEWKGGEAR